VSALIKVRFTHPRKSTSYPADVDPLLTAKEAILELLSPSNGPFLQPVQYGQEYVLVLSRTKTIISPNTTMDVAGVIDGDTLDVVLKSDAARLAVRSNE